MAQGVVDALNRVFRVTYRWQIRQQQIQTSLAFRDVLVPNMTAELLATNQLAFYNTSMKTALGRDLSLTRVEVQRIGDPDYFQIEQVGNIGLMAVDSLVTSQCLSIALKSSSRRRNRNGRMFWPLSGGFAADVVSGTQLTNLNTMAAALTSTYTGLVIIGDFQLVVLGKATSKDTGITPGTPIWTDVTAIRVNPVITNLRSRKVGIGA